jgi:DeoR family transcriptional regulator of aga operon
MAMLPAMRRARIIELVRRDGMAALKDLSDALDVSVSTLRRDVEYLCDSGHLERTHGGAMLAVNRTQGFEPAPRSPRPLRSRPSAPSAAGLPS